MPGAGEPESKRKLHRSVHIGIWLLSHKNHKGLALVGKQKAQLMLVLLLGPRQLVLLLGPRHLGARILESQARLPHYIFAQQKLKALLSPFPPIRYLPQVLVLCASFPCPKTVQTSRSVKLPLHLEVL